MHETAQKIISSFKEGKSQLSTSEIIEAINPNYLSLKENNSKTEIAKLHRQTLHHLNKLVNHEILSITKHGAKGEKYFSLNLGEGEELIGFTDLRKRVIASKPSTLSIPIEGYEQKGIVIKYDPATWVDRLNSVIVFADKIENLEKTLIENIFPIINDSILIENSESFLEETSSKETLKTLNKEAKDYGKKISITLNLEKLKPEAIKNLLEATSEDNLDELRIIFSIDNNELNREKLSKIIDLFSRKKINLYIKNNSIHKAPYFIGKAGPYSFTDKEWHLAEDLLKNASCLGCSQTTAIVDVNKFFQEEGLNTPQFSELMFKISRSILTANSLQRRKSDEYFRNIHKTNKEHESEFLSLSRNYIRFWNFGLSQEDIDSDFALNMISEAKKRIDEFSAAEETIYKSCGMSTRFKIALAPAFETSANLSEAKYNKLRIKEPEDLYSKEIKKTLRIREEVGQIFNGGDEVTFHYNGSPNPEEILKSIEIVLRNYKIPLFNYTFGQLKGDLNLNQFI